MKNIDKSKYRNQSLISKIETEFFWNFMWRRKCENYYRCSIQSYANFQTQKVFILLISPRLGSWERRRRTRRKRARGTSLSRFISTSAFDSKSLLSSLELVSFGTRFGSGTRRLAWGEFYQGSLIESLTLAPFNRVVSGIYSPRPSPVPRRIGTSEEPSKSFRQGYCQFILWWLPQLMNPF